MKNGHGVLIASNGEKYDGKWTNGYKDGWGKEYLPQQNQFYEGSFNTGKRNGDGKMVDGKGQVFEGTWMAGTMGADVRVTHKVPKGELGILMAFVDLYESMVNQFLKKKGVNEPDVKIY